MKTNTIPQLLANGILIEVTISGAPQGPDHPIAAVSIDPILSL